MGKTSHRVAREEAMERLGMTEAEFKAYIAGKYVFYTAGSYVRDGLLGLEPADRDLIVAHGNDREMAEDGFLQVGNDFANHLHPVTGDDTVCWPRSIEEELVRRDLTINAIGRRVGCSELIDPTGGLQDLKARVLRHISEGAYRTDPIRILRTCRFFGQLPKFRIASETMALMKAMVDGGDLDEVCRHRVWLEVDKALKGPAPWKFFQALKTCGALEVLMPELAALAGQTQPKEHHPEGDAWIHTLLVLREACKLTEDPAVRWAAMLHDLGKGLTPAEKLPRHFHHGKNGIPVIEAMCERLCVPSRYARLAILGAETHHQVHDLGKAKPGTIRKMLDRLRAKHDDSLVDVAVLIATADHRGRGPTRENEDHPDAWRLPVAAAAYRAVQVREGLTGQRLIEALVQDRVLAIKEALKL